MAPLRIGAGGTPPTSVGRNGGGGLPDTTPKLVLKGGGALSVDTLASRTERTSEVAPLRDWKTGCIIIMVAVASSLPLSLCLIRHTAPLPGLAGNSSASD